MSVIDIHAHHSMTREDAQWAADDLAQDLAERFDIDYGWDEDVIYFERTGVHGHITVLDGEIHLWAELGLLLLFLKERIEAEVIRFLKTEFDCTFDH